MTEDFIKWWNEDLLAEDNPYVDGTPAYWAWEGWQAALAQPVQEQKPYAYANPDDLSADTAFRWCEINEFTMPVYTTPPAQPAYTKEDVDRAFSAGLVEGEKLAIESQRQWVTLPDDEIKTLWVQYRAALPRYLCFAKAVLAKSKEKNT
jgi:hypothetical protein